MNSLEIEIFINNYHILIGYGLIMALSGYFIGTSNRIEKIKKIITWVITGALILLCVFVIFFIPTLIMYFGVVINLPEFILIPIALISFYLSFLLVKKMIFHDYILLSKITMKIKKYFSNA